ncbi:DUF6519 domain-containing protein [Paracoccus sp. MBLB3053]|uniref:DUF6519 domain-containing protein n=1 Tax=Paracoccus aurantius TaxID=3073814 RepID=A0ABU2HZT7_9RHOB|nr:DUF6519 domain-containing protein [Paracoccus sp. MBLB3053]MDS9470124.1 DUF6519 domain-containing protein [Paracoccus sp. MBLB3053]
MTIDISRKTFNSHRNTAWTTTMQGRVATDAPINEDRSLRDRRLRAMMTHLIGRAGYPATQPDSFLIGLSGGALTIGPGTMYVDGHPAENFGTGTPVFDDILSEMWGLEPVPFDDQPYLPGVTPDPPEDGTHLIYLVTWQRDTTFLNDPSILDPAIFTDTFARRQTVWQVRSFGPVGPGIDCDTDDEDIPGWSALIAPSAARLTTRANPAATDPDPCLLPPDAAFRGTDNRTYFFAIHNIAPDGTPLVKFSRTNAVVATAILSQPASDVLEVAQVAKDDFLRFNPGDWVEITDEVRVLTETPGVIARILSVDDPSDTITLEAALPAGTIRLHGAGPDADQSFFPVVRRWDQTGQVRDETGTLVVDLDLPGADGLIPAPTDGTFLHLEDGVEVALTLDPFGGDFRPGDNWSFIARYADSSVEELDLAPPQDNQLHYCRLALAEAAGGVWTEVFSDCRDPIEEVCCCTVVVRPGEDIQAAIDSLPDDVGGCVCLKPGEHVLQVPIVVSAPNITLHGECHGVDVRLDGSGPALSILGTTGIEVHTIAFSHRAAEGSQGVVEILDSSGISVHDCACAAERGTSSSGIVVVACYDVTIRDCSIAGTVIGIIAGYRSEEIILATNRLDLGGEGFEGLSGIAAPGAIGRLTITGNRIAGAATGVSLNDDATGQERFSLALGSLVADNLVSLSETEEAPDAEISRHGIDSAADRTVLRGNTIRFRGSARAGIRATGSGLVIVENRIDVTATDAARNIGILIGVPDDVAHLTTGVNLSANMLAGMTTAVFIRDAMGVDLSDNDMTPAAAEGAPAVACDEALSPRIAGNTISGRANAIIATNGRNAVIEANAISGTEIAIGLSGELGASVRGNRVTDCRSFGVLAMYCLGRITVVENRVANCGTAGPFPCGIGAFFILGEWHVEANEVLDTGLPVEGDANPQAAAGIMGFLILEARVESNLVSCSDLARVPDGREDRALLMQGLLEIRFTFGDRVISFGFSCQIVDNKFIGKGNRALVELRQSNISDNVAIRFERVFFCNNYVMHQGGVAGAGNASVILDGTAGVVMGNQVKALSFAHPSMNLGNMPGTVIGNVTASGIVNGPNFPAPESSFNLIF